VNRHRRLVAMLNGPDDVLGAKCGIPAEEHVFARGLKRQRIDLGNVPFVELDAEIVLDPRERIFLPDRKNHVIARIHGFANDALAGDAPARIQLVFHAIEQHAGQLAVLDDEATRRMIDDDLDVFFLRILEFPCGCLEEIAGLARHHFHIRRAQP
jgi:hypothetical protein